MYQKRTSRIIKHIDFLMLDLIVLGVSFYISNLLRHGWSALRMNEQYLLMMGILVLFWTFEAIFLEFYQDILRRGYLVELKRVVIQTSLVMVSVFTFMFVTKTQYIYSRAVFIFLWVIGIIVIYAERVLWKHVIRRKLQNSDERTHMLLVCNEKSLKSCIDILKRDKYQSFVLCGAVVYDKDMQGEKVAGVPIVANRDSLFSYVRRKIVDEIFLDLPSNTSQYNEMIEQFLEMGISVHLNLNLENINLPNKMVQNLGGNYVLTTSIKTATRFQIFAKRVMDVLGGIAGLCVTAILFVIIAPIIQKESPGPIFFSQVRVGRNGRKFRIYKFRTMYTDAEERKKELLEQNKMQGFMFKMDDDPRVFPAGKIIRKYSLDEFPQFWNVLKGDMSLVGTRPPTVEEFSQYEARHRVRLAIKPGLTGLWQVSGRSNIVDFEEVVRLDNEYIKNWNLRLDIKIILKTVLVVLEGKGAV